MSINRERMRQFLDATDGGMDIFRKYIDTPFELDERINSSTYEEISFDIRWSERYENYVLRLYSSGRETDRLNAIWYLKWLWDISEEEVYQTINDEMGLAVLHGRTSQEPTLINF